LEYNAQRIMDIKKDRGRYLPLSKEIRPLA